MSTGSCGVGMQVIAAAAGSVDSCGSVGFCDHQLCQRGTLLINALLGISLAALFIVKIIVVSSR
jgi:hypothetical protein